MLKLGVIGSLRSVKSVKPNSNWKPKKFKSVKPNYRGVWKVLVVGFKKWKVLGKPNLQTIRRM